MTPTNDPQHFADQALDNRLRISVDDANALGGFFTAVEVAYSVIREIDSAGVEPAAIFVPTRSGNRAGTRRGDAGRESR